MPPKVASISRVTKSKQGAGLSLAGRARSTRSQTKATGSKVISTSSLPSNALHTSTQSSLPNMTATSSKSTASKNKKPAQPKDPNRPVFFWKPNDGNGYLGQWFPSEFTVDGETYATAEMWMMVQKARLFKDEDVAKEMLATTDPKTHKALGRKVHDFDAKVWDENKLRIVEEGNDFKFTISDDAEHLRTMLMGTGDRELVEASPMDKIWGVGFGEKNAEHNRHKWGQNLLGVALMNVRERLRKEEDETKTREEPINE